MCYSRETRQFLNLSFVFNCWRNTNPQIKRSVFVIYFLLVFISLHSSPIRYFRSLIPNVRRLSPGAHLGYQGRIHDFLKGGGEGGAGGGLERTGG